MATPGYPQMGQMPPMGGPPMGGPPMGGPGGPGGPPMQAQQPMRRGVSKAVPVVVSAGLAVGVFCGLLFGVGKKSEAVASAPAKGSDAKADSKTGSGAADTGATAPTPAPPAAGSATVAAAGSAAGSATGSAAPATGSATPTVVAPKTIKLTVTIKPEGAAEDAELEIDGKDVDGMIVELPADKKSVRVEVKSRGYRSIDKKIELAGGNTAIELEMSKRPSTPTVRPPKRPDRPPSNDSGGLIDI